MSLYAGRREFSSRHTPLAAPTPPTHVSSPSIAYVPLTSHLPHHRESSGFPSASPIHETFMGVTFVLLLTSSVMAILSLYWRRCQVGRGDSGAGDGETGASQSANGLHRAAIDTLPVAVFHCSKDVNVCGEPESNEPLGEDPSSVVENAKTEGNSGPLADHMHERTHRACCAICLTDFQEAERIRMLPRCGHCFHHQCIKVWLLANSSCPLCRGIVLPLSSAPSSSQSIEP